MPSLRFSSRRRFLKAGSLFVPSTFWILSRAWAQFTDTDIPWLASAMSGCADTATANYLSRVAVNGGSVSAANQLAICAFSKGMIADGNASLMIIGNFIEPTSAGSSVTPFYKTVGSDPWVNASLTLSINGFTGVPASSSSLRTGVVTNASLNYSDISIITYVYTAETAGGNDCGSFDNSTGHGLVATYYASASTVGFAASDAETTQTSQGNGYYQFTANGINKLWNFANSGTAHNQFASSGYTVSPSTLNCGFTWFNVDFCSASESTFSNGTFSFCGLAHALTTAQSSQIFSRIQTLRQAFGGGFR